MVLDTYDYYLVSYGLFILFRVAYQSQSPFLFLSRVQGHFGVLDEDFESLGSSPVAFSEVWNVIVELSSSNHELI